MIEIWVATSVQIRSTRCLATISIGINCLYSPIYFILFSNILIKITSDSWSPSKIELRNIKFVCFRWKKIFSKKSMGDTPGKKFENFFFRQKGLYFYTNRRSFSSRLRIWHYFGWKDWKSDRSLEVYGPFIPQRVGISPFFPSFTILLKRKISDS